MEEIGEELTGGNFNDIITDYENEHGEIAGMYREPRGSIYHPHPARRSRSARSTSRITSARSGLFNKIVYIEKEGSPRR